MVCIIGSGGGAIKGWVGGLGVDLQGYKGAMTGGGGIYQSYYYGILPCRAFSYTPFA